MPPVVLVFGTWGRPQLWWRPWGALPSLLQERGYSVFAFRWSGQLGGINELNVTLPGDPDLADLGADQGKLLPWADAGEKLRLYCQVHHFERPHVISHSHGLQVVAMAAALGQSFDLAISIAGPIREDMTRARQIARTRIGRWIQLVDPENDHVIKAGQLHDGRLGWVYELPEGETVITPHQGHSGMTTDVAAWAAHGLLDHFPPLSSPAAA